MDSKEDDDVSIDFSKLRNIFKSEKKEENKEDTSIKKIKEEEKDDEITVDLGKFKNLFKSEKAHEASHAETEKETDDELSFDFGKIKNVFKSSDKEKKSGDEELNVNWSSIGNFFSKYGVLFLVLIPILLSIYIRMQAGYLPVTDDWATKSVMDGLKSQVMAGISQQNPNLPDANKNTIASAQLQKIISENRAQIDGQIKQTSNYFRSFFLDESGKNYMPDIDPYYWYRYSKNIIDHGYPGDVLKDGKSYDDRQLAPLGRFVAPDLFHPYFLAYFYKFLHFFVPDLTLMRSMFYYPIFVSALCVLLVFLIARKIAGNLGGFFAATMMAVNAAFLGRTLFGHADSDAWVVFFPLIVTWLFMLTMDSKNIWKTLGITALAGFFTGLYTFAWAGWWYIFDFLLVTIAAEFIYLALINFSEIKKNILSVFSNESIRNVLLVGITYFISTALFVVVFSGWSVFRKSFLGPLSFPSIKAPVLGGGVWPNVLTTVAELNPGSLNGIIDSVGGSLLFFISMVGLALAISRAESLKKFDFAYFAVTAVFYGAYFMLVKLGVSISVYGFLIWVLLPILVRITIAIYNKDKSYNFNLSILLSLWVVSTIFASIRGIRFTILLAPAFSVAFGVALGKIYIYSSRILTKEFKIHKAISGSVMIILLLLVLVGPTRGAINSAGSDIPLVNDAWYNSMQAVKQDSRPDAIITSWWDFGHHFKALSDRRVTFDGATQTSPAAHWVGQLLMTSDEKEAVGILRMLDCGHNKAYETLFKINNHTIKSIKILNEIIVLSKEEARKKLLEYGSNLQQADTVLSYTHCNPPEGYFIASEDMIGKSGVWGHFGSWNFERADIWQNARKMPEEAAAQYMVNKFNYTKEQAQNIYSEVQSISSDSDANSWVAPWPGYGGTASCSRKSAEIYLCSNGLQVNMSNYDVFGVGQQGIVRPKAAAFTTPTCILKKEFNGSNLDFGITLVPQSGNELTAILSSKELTGSMFTRMFYMQGHGLKYFKLFDHQRGLTGTDIYTYKMDWGGNNATISDEIVRNLEKETAIAPIASEDNLTGTAGTINTTALNNS